MSLTAYSAYCDIFLYDVVSVSMGGLTFQFPLFFSAFYTSKISTILMWRKTNCITPLDGELEFSKELLEQIHGQLTSYNQPTQAKIG